MDGFLSPERVNWPHLARGRDRLEIRVAGTAHSAHGTIAAPHRRNRPWGVAREEFKVINCRVIDFTSVTMTESSSTAREARGVARSSGPRSPFRCLTGRPFRMVKIRANRDKPGLRPQHQKAVDAAATLGVAKVTGGGVGARELMFSPGSLRTSRPLARHRHRWLDRAGASNPSPPAHAAIGKANTACHQRWYLQPQGTRPSRSSIPRGGPT